MVTSDGEQIYYWVGLYLEQLPFWRRFLARYFEKYKITEKEYREWLFNRIKN